MKKKKAINNFCYKTNSVVYINHLSNFSNEYALDANLYLLTAEFEDINNIKPQIIISIGGQTGDYPFYLAFSKNNLTEIEHWRVCDDGNVVDTYDKLTRIYQGSIVEFFNSSKSICNNHSFFELWKDKVNKKSIDYNVPFSSVSIANCLHDKIPAHSVVQFSILNSLRIWNLFHMDPSIECYSNVGAFGIDGGMSTLIGQSMVTNELSFMIIGDLAFFYDMNCLSIRTIKNNVRILLINNNGGIEFKLYSGRNKQTDRYIAAANHRGRAKEWAESCGFEYFFANNMTEFMSKVDAFISKSDKPIIFEAFVSDQDESDAYLKIINKNRPKTSKDTMKNIVKGIVGEAVFNKFKHMVKG